MGAQEFNAMAEGKNASAAFNKAVSEGQDECGHGGYTGTIAEKHNFAMFTKTPMPADEALKLVEKLREGDDPQYNDKWGPACCVEVVYAEQKNPSVRYFLFFGIASS